MKLATFRRDEKNRVGLVHDDGRQLFDLQQASTARGGPNSAFASLLDLINAGQRGLDAARELFAHLGSNPAFSTSVEEAKLLAPLPEPPQVRDFMCFPTHIKQAFRGLQRLSARARGDERAAATAEALSEVPTAYRSHPSNYITNRFNVVGHGATIRWPRYSNVMDFELELGMVIGKKGSNVPASKAKEHIFGFTIFNDFSARDTQTTEMPTMMGPGKAKSFDTGNAIGPWIVTADEIQNPYELAMKARVNGETWSDETSTGMMYTFEDMIVHVSRDETVQAGEIFGSGTVGNGSGLEQDRFLKDGDIVELEIEKIGILRNKVVRQAAA
jgi:2-keto-4-pentenoate hydratase/2-oxohepta-3-ene-1,7-dioic acid hydratase in catechol pathway